MEHNKPMKPKHSKVLLLITFLLGIVMVWGGMIYSVYSASQYYWAGIIASLVGYGLTLAAIRTYEVNY